LLNIGISLAIDWASYIKIRVYLAIGLGVKSLVIILDKTIYLIVNSIFFTEADLQLGYNINIITKILKISEL
jgi:hypothetical protein